VLQARAALTALEHHADTGEFAGSAAGYKCQQISKFRGGASVEARQLSFLAYHSLTAQDAPALHAWVALDYSRDALSAGFYQSAANAVDSVLNIAQHNQLQQLKVDGLVVQAEVQSAQGQYAEALVSVRKAQGLSADAAELRRLQAIEAKVLFAAGRWQDAQAIYQPLWQQQALVSAGLALLNIYLQQQPAQALTLSTELQQVAAHNGDREWLAQSRLRHAMALLCNGQFDAAHRLFAESSRWLEQHRLALYLPELRQWTSLLVQQGQLTAAVSALQHSLLLQQQLDAEFHSVQAQLSSTLRIAEQRSRELKLVDLQQQLTTSRTDIQARQQQLWLLTILCAGLALLLMLLLWRRFYR